MKAIWTQDEASYHGELVSFERIWSWPKPVQTPHPPVFVGGDAPNTLARVVRYGDGWIPMIGNNDPDLLEKKIQRMHQLTAMLAEAGRGPVPITTFGTPSDPAVIARLGEAGVTRCIFGINAAPADQVLGRLDRCAARERHHAGLGGCVVRLFGLRAPTQHRGVVDDDTRLALDHVGQDRARHPKGAGQGNVENGIPLVVGHFHDGRRPAETCIIEKNVDTPKFLDRPY